MRRSSVLLALAAATMLAAACNGTGGGSTAPPIIIVSGGVTYLKVTDATGRDTVSSLPGHSIQLNAKAYDGSLNPVTITVPITWSSTHDSVATVDNNGLVTTMAAGTTYVFAQITVDSTKTLKDSALVAVLKPQ